MDGYAVRAADVASAKPASPARLRLAGRVAAGEVFAGEVAAGTCVRLFTGSPLPPGADAVVMQEDTRIDPGAPGEVLILAPAGRGENVRARGQDVKQGTMLAEAGEVLTPRPDRAAGCSRFRACARGTSGRWWAYWPLVRN